MGIGTKQIVTMDEDGVIRDTRDAARVTYDVRIIRKGAVMEIRFNPFTKADYRVYPNTNDREIVPVIAYAENGVRYQGAVMRDVVLIIDSRGLSVLIRDWENGQVAEYFLRCDKAQAQLTAGNLPYSLLNVETFKELGFIMVFTEM